MKKKNKKILFKLWFPSIIGALSGSGMFWWYRTFDNFPITGQIFIACLTASLITIVIWNLNDRL